MISWSEANDKIAAAFVKAQAACNGAKKASNNPAFKSKYADLTAVWAACEDALAANDLGVMQFFGEIRDGKMHMTTMLVHSSGQWVHKEGAIPLPKNDPQGLGSATTYFRRYSLAALMGIVQEDDDGNAASQTPRSTPAPKPAEATITPEQYEELVTLADEVNADSRQFCTFFQIPAVQQLPASRFEEAKTLLNKKRQKKAA